MPTLIAARSPATVHRLAPLLVAAAAGLLFLLRFGYGYASSDQDEFLPLLFHHLDPTLFPADPFVQGQLGGSGVRRWFVGLLYVPSLLLPVPAVVLAAYVLAATGLATGVFRIGTELTDDPVAAALATIGTLVLTPQWTLGGNDLLHSMLAPSMGAWAFALWGLAFALRGRYVVAAVALGAGTYLQALVGLQVAGLVALVLLASTGGGRRAAWFLGLYVLVAGLALAPLVLGQASAGAAAPVAAGGGADEGVSLFYIMAVFRNPHHYLPHAFSLRSVLRFGLLVAAGGAALVFLRHREALRHERAVLVLLGGVAASAAVGFVGATLLESLFVAKLQLFKPTVLAKTIFVIGLAGAVVRLLPDALYRLAAVPLRRPVLTGVLLALAWAGVLAAAVVPGGPLARLLPAVHPPDADLLAVAEWARAETPPASLFAVPPSVSSFRSRARRGVVVNFKAFPFEPAAARAWYERLQTFAPLPVVSPRDRDRGAQLDAAYAALPPDALRAAARRYDVRYVLRRTPLAADGLTPVFSSGTWTVYRVDGAS